MQKYREVLCPRCSKEYMWLVVCEQDTHFVDKEGHRIAIMSKCPQCNSKLAVFEGQWEATLVDDLSENVKAVREYGI